MNNLQKTFAYEMTVSPATEMEKEDDDRNIE